MSEARIGRIVTVAMHEALASRLPLRLEFYEHWLEPPRLLAGSVGLASFLAVLSFLRLEGDAYPVIVDEAGRHAADWMYADVPAWTRARWRWLPRGLRLRVALRLARRLAEESAPGAGGRIRRKRQERRLDVEGSAFCRVRSPVTSPLCGFYAAALRRFCDLLDLHVVVTHEACRAMGSERCTMAVTTPGHETAPESAAVEPPSAA